MIVFGILNMTSDSFSDGGEFLDEGKAEEKGKELMQTGAFVIDISAQSSNVNAIQIEPELEWNRMSALIKRFQSTGYKISVDTYKPYVIQKSIEAKVDYINCINSFRDKESLEILAANKDLLPELILMYSHHNGDLAEAKSNLTPNTIMDSIYKFFDFKIGELQRIGVPESKLIFDPGMGLFLGADPLLSIEVLKNISEFKKRFGRVMVSVSRKSFIGNLLGGIPPKERGAGTLAVEIFLYQQKIDFIRTHDVRQISQAMKILEVLC
ncbi:MAG: dihydropteroate synthase [Leptospiraceae bacterium]|nr:dihydropteroate synthase [Leptospiraceae bacterium]